MTLTCADLADIYLGALSKSSNTAALLCNAPEALMTSLGKDDLCPTN